MSKESTLILEELKKFCVDKINDMKSNPNKGQYGSGCIVIDGVQLMIG